VCARLSHVVRHAGHDFVGLHGEIHFEEFTGDIILAFDAEVAALEEEVVLVLVYAEARPEWNRPAHPHGLPLTQCVELDDLHFVVGALKLTRAVLPSHKHQRLLEPERSEIRHGEVFHLILNWQFF